MPTSKQLISILENLKKQAGELEEKSVVFETDETEKIKTIVQHTPLERLDDYEKRLEAIWKEQEEQSKHQPPQEERVVGFPERNKSMFFLPLLLTESWLPLRGNHNQFQRINRGVRISSATDYYSNGKPIGIPSGLLARRILLTLVSRAVIEKSAVVDVGSVSELLRESGLSKSTRQVRRIQKTLFQLFMVNVKIWGKETIHSGQMFECLDLDVEETKQEKFSFIPEKVVFRDKFYKDVIEGRSYPFLTEDILKASGALEHDVLLWLLNRQTSISKKSAAFIGYGLLYNQFGQPNQSFKHFKSDFRKLVRVIREKYERKVEVHKNGLLLYQMPSRVPVKQERKLKRFKL
tara:strand:- start:102 stop:1148 length:1047 start_codon:yes stop_codon:yes gene_type:complete